MIKITERIVKNKTFTNELIQISGHTEFITCFFVNCEFSILTKGTVIIVSNCNLKSTKITGSVSTYSINSNFEECNIYKLYHNNTKIINCKIKFNEEITEIKKVGPYNQYDNRPIELNKLCSDSYISYTVVNLGEVLVDSVINYCAIQPKGQSIISRTDITNCTFTGDWTNVTMIDCVVGDSLGASIKGGPKLYNCFISRFIGPYDFFVDKVNGSEIKY